MKSSAMTSTDSMAAFSSTSTIPTNPSTKLPEKIMVGYTSNKCHDLNDMSKVTQAVKDGVNVLVWCFLAFKTESMEHQEEEEEEEEEEDKRASQNQNERKKNHRMKIDSSDFVNSFNFAQYKQTLKDMGYTDVVHLAAFGGWNGPHLPSGYTANELYQQFQQFNEFQFNDHYRLFDGIDWDLEGHDDVQSPTNKFTKECLDQMGGISALAKRDGYIVSMAPPESYLDITSTKFSLCVNLTYTDDEWHQDFKYHGWNVYAYILAKWGTENVIDFVFLQFYESYSHAAYKIYQLGMDPSDFLVDYVTKMVETNVDEGEAGLYVNFQDYDPSMGLANQFISLPLTKLVLGFANGWAYHDTKGDGNDNNDVKVVYFDPATSIQRAYDRLKLKRYEPRGVGFWVIEEEGNQGVEYAKGLNKVLNIRDMSEQIGISTQEES